MSDFVGRVVGLGLLALDVVIADARPKEAQVWAGGTCGNVLTALSFFGWHAAPIARISDDAAGNVLKRDLEYWHVDTHLLSCAPVKATPVIVERIFRDLRGNPEHKFSRTCPTCGAWLPGYQAVTEASVLAALEILTSADVFFFDRVSRGAITAARHYAQKGAVVFFEPSGIGADSLFAEALDAAHVIKYSRERLGEYFADRPMPPNTLLQVETMGSSGLRYRSRLRHGSGHSWCALPSLVPLKVVDTAGAGDWTSAGMINELCRGGLARFKLLSTSDAEEAVKTGQALAAWTCGYEGPRGGMYVATRTEIYAEVDSIRRGLQGAAKRHVDRPLLEGAVGNLCAGCREAAPKLVPARLSGTRAPS